MPYYPALKQLVLRRLLEAKLCTWARRWFAADQPVL
jgi:hypothetical protein